MIMNETIFYFAINMSISGSLVILLMLMIRSLKIIPRRLVYPLWSVVLVRLLLPFAMSSSISAFHYFSGLIKRVIPIGRALDENLTISNYFNAASSLTPMEYRTKRFQQIFEISSKIWIIGLCTALILLIVLYLCALKQYKNAVCIKDNIYKDSNTPSPFLLGIKKARIIFPDEFDINSDAVKHIIAHEKTHIKRHDNFLRMVGLITVCVHWFNPIVWFGFSCFLKDMELSCDEIVVKSYNSDDRKAYANTLLGIAERGQNKNLFHASFGKTSTRSRIFHVLTYKKLSIVGIIISSGFLLLVAFMLLTNPKI